MSTAGKTAWTAVFALAAVALSGQAAFARQGAPPSSWQSEIPPPAAVDLAPMDADAARARAKSGRPKPGPVRFAEPRAVSFRPGDSGRWRRLPDGDHLWQLALSVPGATDLNLGFSSFRLPPGSSLHVWSQTDTGRHYFGPFGAGDQRRHGQLWTPPLPGDSLVVELRLPKRAEFAPLLHLSQLGAGFLHAGRDGLPVLNVAGECNQDVACPEADSWRRQISSVALYSIGGIASCTGTAIADAAGSGRPLFVTAHHCGLNAENAASVVTFWRYEAPECGQQSGGNRTRTISGARWLAGRKDVDFALLELDHSPAELYQVSLAGWDRSGVAPQSSVGIHHPQAAEKSISFNSDPVDTVGNCIYPGYPGTHWEVNNWERGTTEPGSSGSGLWDAESGLLVGFLSGGYASCSQPHLSDCYGKLAVAWDGETAARRLRDWLDPDATGVLQVAELMPPLVFSAGFERSLQP